MKQKTCIILAGPTASGKTDLAISIAKLYNTEIISADSRQCYRELNIGVAKPCDEQLATVHHHFINSHFITENLSAADFEQYALSAAEKILEYNDVVVMCGGTGLYIKAFCEGLDDIPEADNEIKKIISENYHASGIAWLQDKIKKEDPFFWEKGENKNPHRLMRALEVMRNTGKSVLTYQRRTKKERNFNILKIGLDLRREILYDRINNRTDKMRQEGLTDEVWSLTTYKNLNALQTVGYRELIEYFENKISEEKAYELIKQNTRHYAKRQMTWFKKDPEFVWVKPEVAVQKIAIEMKTDYIAKRN